MMVNQENKVEDILWFVLQMLPQVFFLIASQLHIYVTIGL